MMVYSIDMRERAITFIENSGRINEAVKIFCVSRTALKRLLDKIKRGETLEDRPPKRPWKKTDPDQLQTLVQTTPDFSANKSRLDFNAIWAGNGRECKFHP